MSPVRPIQVLVVDDEPYICEISKEFLEQSKDIRVETASSASNAMTALGQRHFDAIVSDYQMPKEDGIQFLKSLRNKGDQIPFILFTGKGREEVVIEALNSGADSYLQKGGKPESQYVELEHRIRAAVRQRRGEEALRESEERYRKVFFSNRDSICITRLHDGMFVSANHGFAEMSGYEEEDIIGRTSLEINIWKDPEDRRKIVEALRTKGDVRDYEARFLTKKGEIDGSMSASIIELNGVPHILNVTRDITERKRTEATLKESEERYRQLFELESDALVLVDKRDGRLLEVNHAAERMYGYGREALLRLRSTDLSAQVEETTRAMKESATSVPLRYHRKKDGSIFPVEITATNHDWQGIPTLLCAIRDITERERTEQALRESEARSEKLAEHARTVTWEIDADGLFTYVSRVSEPIWGYRPDELVGKKHFFDLIPEEYRAKVRTMTSEAFKRKERFENMEGHLKTKDGDVRLVSTNGIPLLNADGTLRGYQGSETDITEHKRNEMYLRQKNDELQKANEELAAQEGKIREAEVRYRLLFENMLNGFAYCRMLFDHDGRPEDFIYLKVNDAFGTITGLRNVEGRKVTEVIPGIRESSPELFAIYSQVTMTGRPETFEIDFKPMNFWLRISVFRPELGSFVAVFEDITERKRAEVELRESEEKYRLIANNMADVVTVMDMDLHFTYVSPSIRNLRGFTDEEAIGSSLDQVLTPASMQLALSALAQEMELEAAGKADPDRTLFLELEEYRKDGSTIWVGNRISFVRDENGHALAIVALSSDITERKRAEMEIRSAREQLEEAHHLAHIGTWDWQTGTDSVVWSDELFHIAGRDPLLRAPPFAEQPQYYEPLSWKILNNAVKDAMTTGEPYRLELKMIRTDGSVREVVAIGAVKRGANGKVIGLHGIVQDITERRQAEEALHEASRRLNLLSSVTRHDIANQLTALQGHLALLRKEHIPASSNLHLQKAEAGAERISAIIQFTREYEDIGMQAPAWASLGRQTADAFANLLPRGVTLKDDTKGVEVLADPLVEKIPYNLIDNSLRHGEHVTRIEMSAEKRGDAMLIVYEDDGVGISDEEREHLFEKGSGKNTGFGLFLSREILAITGITITENGRRGQGARFEMLVPPGAWRLT